MATMPDASHVKPQIISMDIDDGPRWVGSGITPVKVRDLREPTAQTTGLLMYTSGTTGVPKGVLLSHGNLIAAGNNVCVAHKLESTDTGMCASNLPHQRSLRYRDGNPCFKERTGDATPVFCNSFLGTNVPVWLQLVQCGSNFVCLFAE